MKDSQYIPGPPKNNNNGDIMSGGAGGGGRREEGGASRTSGGGVAGSGGGGAGGGGGGYPHWPPHPLHSPHHQFRSHHAQRLSILQAGVRSSCELLRIKTIHVPFPYSSIGPMPRMMGSYYSSRGMPPAAAHFTSSGNWGRATPSQGGGGLKPPERWADSSAAVSTGQQAEGGMDLSQTRSNGSQPNGLAKDVVSVIAANPLRTGDKPLDPSDRSEDEDDDCMVIEEGEEAPRTGELPPAASRQVNDDAARQMRLQRDPSIAQEAPPGLDPLPAAHHNPLRHPSLPASGSVGPSIRPESSHHLPPSVTQPLRSDSSSPLQRPSHSGVHRGDTSSPHQALPKASSHMGKQPESSHHLPVSVQGLQKSVSQLSQKPGSPSLQAQQTLQFAKQILAQKQIQDSQLAQQKINESAYQQLLAQQKLFASHSEAAHQLLVQQKMPGGGSSALLFSQRPDLSAVLQAQVPSHKSADQPPQQHKPASPSTLPQQPPQLPSHSKVTLTRSQEGGSMAAQYRDSVASQQAGQPTQPESLSLTPDNRLYQPRHESAALPPILPINIPSSLQVIPHPAGTSVSGSSKDDARQSCLDQRPDIGSLPPQVAARLPSGESSALPGGSIGSLPEAAARLPTLESCSLPPRSSDALPPQVGARLPATEPPVVPLGSTGTLPQVAARLPSAESSSLPSEASQPPTLPTIPTQQPSSQIGEAKTGESLTAQGGEAPSTPQTLKERPSTDKHSSSPHRHLPGSSTVEDVDHVESMLENMFQQEMSPPPMPGTQPSATGAALTRRSPALTEDKVVQILQDRDEEQPMQLKQPSEIKTEIVEDGMPAVPVASGSAFMQVESELEKMFAGIVEAPGDDKPETPESSKSSKKSNSVKRSKGRPRAKKDMDRGKKNRNKSPLADSLKHKRKFGPRAEKFKEGSNDSSSISTGQMYKWRGPYIKVSRGLDGRPSTVTLVNSSSASGEEEKDKSMDKSIKRKAPRIVEGRTKGPGLYSSTLSARYNSTIIDVTWTCVFCNRRSHCENGLGGEPAGDLFGPYLVHIKLEPSLGGPSDVDVAIEQRKRGGGKQLSLRAGGKANHSFSPPQKKSRKSSVSDKDSCEPPSGVVSKDVWVHEACAIWAPGVILVGPHLIGLDDAVSISLHSKCAVCGESGACISCLQHGCLKVCHYGCARATQWSLDEETFHARCLNHKKPITMSLALQQGSV